MFVAPADAVAFHAGFIPTVVLGHVASSVSSGSSLELCALVCPQYRSHHIYKQPVMSYSWFELLTLRRSEAFSAKVAYNYGVLFQIFKPRDNAVNGQ
jgi:hypothetical protein